MATKKEKDKEILMRSAKPGLPVNIKKPSIPQSSNAMGASGTILNNVNVRPTRAQTAMHDVKTFHKEMSKRIKNDVKSKNVSTKAGGVLAGTIAAGQVALAPGLQASPALANVISGQIGYNKNKRAMFGRGIALENTNVAANRERSKGLSASDSTLAVQGKLPAVTSGRDTPLPSSDSILKNAANKVLDFIKR